MTTEPRWWSVRIEFAGPESDEALDPVDSRLDLLLDALTGRSGVVSGGGHQWSATVSVEAERADWAADEGAKVIAKAARWAHMPGWPAVRIETVAEDELERELATPSLPALVGVAEAADILGVSKQRASVLARAHPDFPKPLVVLAATPVWVRAAIEAFLTRWDRRPGPKTAEQTA